MQTLAENTLKICKDIAALDAFVQIVLTALQAFKKGMLKDMASADSKHSLDYQRDEMITGFLTNVSSEKKFPHKDKAIKKALSKLVKITRKYGLSIKRLPMDAETAAIDNLLADIAEEDFTLLAPTGITRWLPEIEAANTEFKEAASVYLSESTEAETTKSASRLAPELEDALEGLYAMMFALLKTSPSNELKKAYEELDNLVDSMR